MSNSHKYKCGDVICYVGFDMGLYSESERWIGLIIGVDKQYYKYKVIRTIHDARNKRIGSMGITEHKNIDNEEYLVP